MFNLQSFSSQKGSVADGATANALNRIRTLLTKLLHSPETGVLWLTSAEGVANINRGHIVSIFTDINQCILSDATGPLVPARGIAICLSKLVEPGNGGYFRFAGEADVLLIAGDTPDESNEVKVFSGGEGTTGAVIGAQRRVGMIVDTTEFVDPDNRFVRVVIETGCLPTAV